MILARCRRLLSYLQFMFVLNLADILGKPSSVSSVSLDLVPNITFVVKYLLILIQSFLERVINLGQRVLNISLFINHYAFTKSL